MTDLELIEACLTPTMRAALDELCASLDVPRDRWRSVPALARVFETAAVARRAEDISRRSRRTESRDQCERIAAQTLRLEHKTMVNRRHRMRLFARSPASEARPSRPAIDE